MTDELRTLLSDLRREVYHGNRWDDAAKAYTCRKVGCLACRIEAALARAPLPGAVPVPPELRELLLHEFGTTDPDLIRAALADRRAALTPIAPEADAKLPTADAVLYDVNNILARISRNAASPYREEAHRACLMLRELQTRIRTAPEAEADAAPNWYSADEMYDWLRRENYSEQIARELAALIAKNYQLAFSKGFEMGQRSTSGATVVGIHGDMPTQAHDRPPDCQRP